MNYPDGISSSTIGATWNPLEEKPVACCTWCGKDLYSGDKAYYSETENEWYCSVPCFSHWEWKACETPQELEVP